MALPLRREEGLKRCRLRVKESVWMEVNEGLSSTDIERVI